MLSVDQTFCESLYLLLNIVFILPLFILQNPVKLDVYDTLHLFCVTSCQFISVTSDNPVAVISGKYSPAKRLYTILALLMPSNTTPDAHPWHSGYTLVDTIPQQVMAVT